MLILPRLSIMMMNHFSFLCLLVISFIILFVNPVVSSPLPSKSNESSKPLISLIVMPTKQASQFNADLDVAESGGLGGLTGGLGGGAIKKVVI